MRYRQLLKRVGPSLALGLLIAQGAWATVVRMADTVQLSNGNVVRVLSRRDISTSSGRATGASIVVFFEDQAGNRASMQVSTDDDENMTTVFATPSSKERVEVKMQLGFGNEGLDDPVVVRVNGKRFRGIIPRNDAMAEERFAKKVRAEFEKLSGPFRSALQSLHALGEAGYAGLGAGWTAIEQLIPIGALDSDVTITTKAPMSDAEQEGFQALFSSK